MAAVALSENYEKFTPFLYEIRKRLLFIASIFLVASGFGFFYYERIISLVLDMFRLEGVNIVFTSPFQFMNLAISSGLFVGTIVTFPLVIFQFLSFIKPALNKKEFRMILTLIPLAIILFLAGFSFGAMMMRYVVGLFYERSVGLDIGNYLDISRLLSQIITTSIFMGLAFEFPIVLTILLRLNIITQKALAGQRIIAYSASLLFAALLPPTDLVSLALLTLPLVILFELTLLLNKLMFAKKGR